MGQRELLTLMSAIMALMALGIDTMLPAFDEIRKAFDLGDSFTARRSRSSPSSSWDSPSRSSSGGRSRTASDANRSCTSGSIIYLVGAVGSALAPTFELTPPQPVRLGHRSGRIARVVATAIIRDRFAGQLQMAKAMSQVMAVFMLVPVLAPTIGAGLIAILPWRSVFWFCAVWAVRSARRGALRLRESLDPANRRPFRLRVDRPRLHRGGAHTRVTGGYTTRRRSSCKACSPRTSPAAS